MGVIPEEAQQLLGAKPCCGCELFSICFYRQSGKVPFLAPELHFLAQDIFT